ncbi:MAG: TonB-dependent receptor [Chitinophagaceae bacterium]|nr:TonB-dependent receptor [Chitinophagaceae bacterium]MCW5928898.1 TonB-dependent receptor [Chitinophagaceae bacterium]
MLQPVGSGKSYSLLLQKKHSISFSHILIKLILWIVLSLAALITHAQSGRIAGTIYSASNEILYNITVSLEGQNKFTQTDAEGNFVLDDVSAGRHVVLATGVGYSAKSDLVSVADGKTTYIRLVMDISRTTLMEVVVRSPRKIIVQSASATRTNTLLKDLPQSIQGISRATIEEQQLYRLEDALKNVAGVNISSSYGSYNFRGFITNSGSFLTNGIKGSAYPEGVSPSLANIEKVEVLRGPTAILYGENAASGNINMVTKQPKKITTVNARVSAGSFSLYRAQADLTGSLNKKKSLYYVAGLGFEDGGRFTKHFDNNNLLLFGSLKWEAGQRTAWQLNATYNRDRSSGNYTPDLPFYEGRLFSVPATFFTGASDARYKGDSYQLQSILSHQLSRNWSLNLLLGLSKSRADRVHYDHNDFVDPNTNEVERTKYISVMEEPVKAINLYTNGKFSTGMIHHTLTGGVDLNFYNGAYPEGFSIYGASPINVVNPDYKPYIPPSGFPDWYYASSEKFTTNTYGIYFQDQLSLGEKWKAVLGARFNHYHFYYRADSVSYDNFATYIEEPENTTAFIPRAGIVFQPSAVVSLYADYSTGFIPQYSNTKIYGGPFDPERTHQVEVGFKGDFLQHRLVPTIAVYQIIKNNVLKSDPTPDQPMRQRPLGEVTSRGLEITVTGNIAKGLDLIANYAFNDTKITKSNEADEVGTRFDNSPKHIASLWATYTLPENWIKGVQLGIGHRYTSDRYISNRRPDQQNVLMLPQYQVTDAMLGYRYKQYSLALNINNIFDKTYALGSYWSRSYFPGAPRNWLLTLGYSLR